MWRVSGPKRGEETWCEKTVEQGAFPYVIRVIISRRVRWLGHVVCIGMWEMHTKY
jgi:hypothetical protein